MIDLVRVLNAVVANDAASITAAIVTSIAGALAG
jgi:hypothetical protein